MSKGNRNQNQNQQSNNTNLGELHGNVEVEVQDQQQQQQQQATASSSSTSGEKQSMFSTKHSGGGFAGTYVGAIAGALGSAAATLLSDESVGWQDAASAGVSAIAGFGVGYGVDNFITNDYARYAAASAVAGGVGFTLGSVTQGFKGDQTPIEVTELPSMEA